MALNTRLVIYFKLVSGFPNIKKANRRVETIKDGQGHGDVRDYHPSPLPEELQVRWPEAGVSLDQCVNEPNRNVRHEEESHNLSTGPKAMRKSLARFVTLSLTLPSLTFLGLERLLYIFSSKH